MTVRLLVQVHAEDVWAAQGARFDDELSISVVPVEMKRAWFWLEQEARLADGRICAAARIKAACVRHSDMRPQPIPEQLVARLAA